MGYGFTELVKNHFHFLIAEFGFSNLNEDYNLRVSSDRLVEFRSEATIVIVVDDKYSVCVHVGPVLEPPIAQVELTTVISFLAPDEQVSAYISPPELKGQPQKRIRYQVEKKALLLKQYCEPFLKGDFSRWLDLENFIIEGARANYKKLTGKDLPETALAEYVRVKTNQSKAPDA